MKHKILLVDDEPNILEALERIFHKKYLVYKATSGAEGLDILEQEDIALILSDQRMPKMTGVTLLQKSHDIKPHTIRILLTGYTDIESTIEAINSGRIYKYITKPWDSLDLVNSVDKALEQYELAAEVRSKTQALKKAHLELRQLDDAKTEFMYLINHELKTPITVLSSYLQLLNQELQHQKQKEYLLPMGDSINRLQKLTNDVLELISTELRLHNVQLSTLNLNTISQAFIETHKQKLTDNNIDISINLSQKVIESDKILIEKVMQRLLENALQFAQKNSTIEIQEKNQKIQVSNKGKSLSKEVIDKILQPFTLDEKTLNHSKGLGLGLSLCQAYLKLLNSKLEFQTDPKGVTVGFHY